MEDQQTPSNSLSSAVDLSGAPSPSLVIEPDHSSRRSSLARRRSWNNKLREAARGESSSGHPLHLDLDSNMSPSRGGGNPIHEYTNNIYSDSQVGTSRASLIHRDSEHETEDDGHREDDQAHLTANMSHTGTDSLLLENNTGPKSPDYSIDDPEIEGASTPRTHRRTQRHGVPASPLKKTETALKSMSKSLRRISLRVVNLANTGLEGQLRLGDGNEDEIDKLEEEEEDGPDLKKVLQIRGRTLGFLGPESKIRLALFNLLVHPCVPCFLFFQLFD